MKVSTKSILAATLAVFAAGAGAADLAEEKAQALASIKQFGGALKSELEQAMKSGGPTEAIKVCNLRAPEIATQVSQAGPWEVARTSLKIRNPANAPDAWELAVLKDFEARKAAGEAPDKIDHIEVVEQDGRKMLRYMKAIPTAEVCTKCHGESIPEPVEAKLKTLYPQDQARGFGVGDIRGAFTLTRPVDGSY